MKMFNSYSLSRFVTLLVALLIVLPYGLCGEAFTIGKIAIRAELGFDYRLDSESNEGRSYKVAFGSMKDAYVINILLATPRIIIGRESVAPSRSLLSMVEVNPNPTYQDYIRILDNTNGPAFFERLRDYAYAGYEKVSTGNSLRGESYLWMPRNGGDYLMGPILLTAFVVTDSGVLDIDVCWFPKDANDFKEALGRYGEIRNGDLRISSQGQLENIYDSMKNGDPSAPHQLKGLFELFDQIIKSLKVSSGS